MADLTFAEKLAALKAKQNLTRADITAAQPVSNGLLSIEKMIVDRKQPTISEAQKRSDERVRKQIDTFMPDEPTEDVELSDEEATADFARHENALEDFVDGSDRESNDEPDESDFDKPSVMSQVFSEDESDAPVHADSDKVILTEDEPEEKPKFRPSPSYILPVKMTPLEADIEKDRELGRKAIEPIEGEAIYTENQYLADQFKDEDKKERFKIVYTSVIQQNCLGKNIDEIDEMLRERHETLFDDRTGIQALLAYRKELLKDVDSEERARRLRNDYLHQPSKKAIKEGRSKKSDKPKVVLASTEKKPKQSMEAIMIASIMAANPTISKDEATARVNKLMGKK